MDNFTHINDAGNVHMVDVSEKANTKRKGVAQGKISMSKKCIEAIKSGEVIKGDVLGTARIAGIMGAKNTSSIIPLAHPLPITHLSLDFSIEENEILATCTAETTYKTGVEMEALTGVNIALLTIYDMCKAIDKSMVISDVKLLYKSGGKSGIYEAK